MANSAVPDQLASEEANWSGTTLFAKQGISRFSSTRVYYHLNNYLLFNNIFEIIIIAYYLTFFLSEK